MVFILLLVSFLLNIMFTGFTFLTFSTLYSKQNKERVEIEGYIKQMDDDVSITFRNHHARLEVIEAVFTQLEEDNAPMDPLEASTVSPEEDPDALPSLHPLSKNRLPN